MKSEWFKFEQGKKYLIDGIKYTFLCSYFGVLDNGNPSALFQFTAKGTITFFTVADLEGFDIKEVL